MRATAIAAVATVATALRAPTDKPNFVMFFVDDLGYGDVGFTGHPTTSSPNIDALAHGGKVLTTWYSGCPVCSGSRGALMTGRQYVRLGIPGVFGPSVGNGLPLNETTVASQLKKAGYQTAAMGKWHLGQRPMYLPMARGFDRYLGIPYSDDMGNAQQQYSCNKSNAPQLTDETNGAEWQHYIDAGYTGWEGPNGREEDLSSAKGASSNLALVYQNTDGNISQVPEQPLQFRTLAQKYRDYVVGAIGDFAANPFFLYMPFSHVHTTSGSQPEKQYSGCAFEGATPRGKFGDALAEADWIVGEVRQKLEAEKLDKNTMIIFSADNGPWMIQGKSGGSTGLHYGRHAGYWNVGKGSTWEGGIREAAFAYWPGQIEPATRTSEVVSSLDLFPTLSALAGVPLPTDRVYDGRDASQVMLKGAPSKHDFLWFYGGAAGGHTPSAVRYGKYKAHFATGPGLGGCTGCKKIEYNSTAPLLFDVEQDPSEAYPIEDQDVFAAIAAAYEKETSGPHAMTFQKLITPPAGPGEDEKDWGICCDRSKKCVCSP